MRPLYIITTVYNPRRFASRYRLYNLFAAWVAAAGARLLTVEISFGERQYAVTEPDNPWHLRLNTRHEMWIKERALSLGLQRLHHLDPQWGYVAWMDCDIKLARDDWAEETVHLLQHYAVIQMFGDAAWLGPDYGILFASRSIARNFHEFGVVDWYDHPGLTFRDVKQGTYDVKAGHPGLAWAFRRDELVRIGGWLDICVNGSGDLHMVGCYTGKPTLALPLGLSAGYRQAIARYGELCERQIRRNVSFMPGTALHYWHGKAKHRGYEDRGGLLVRYRYDPYTDIIQDVNGLWRWNLDDPRVLALASETRRSLAARNEDGTEL